MSNPIRRRDATRFWFVTLADGVQQDSDRITNGSDARAGAIHRPGWVYERKEDGWRMPSIG